MKNLKIKWIGGLALAGALMGAPLCNRVFAGHTPDPGQSKINSAPVLTPLEDAVRHELIMLPYFSVFDNLEYRVEGDKVELTGQVTRPILASDAKGVVARVKGISEVVNHIEVLPVSPNDDRIRRMVYRKIYGDSAMFIYSIQPVPPIRIIVKNGNVTLEGLVSRSMDKSIANIEANTVAGVFSVTDNLKVQS
jgi:hyperosmotically inducible periplasmic protein